MMRGYRAAHRGNDVRAQAKRSCADASQLGVPIRGTRIKGTMNRKSRGMAHKARAPSLFVSHSSDDRRLTWEIVKDFEKLGVRCWYAPRDLRGGVDYRSEIVEAIDSCDALLVIFSERCNESVWVPREVGVADDAGKTIISLRIEDAQPKRGLRLSLANLQQVDAFRARDVAIREVLLALHLQPDERGTARRNGRGVRRARSGRRGSAKGAAGPRLMRTHARRRQRKVS
jgi:TIR domain-containing protein